MIHAHSYFFINVAGLIVVLAVYLFARNDRRGMFLSGLTLVPASLLSFLHEKSYWNPLRLNTGGWGIEDVMFCFSFGSLVWFLGIRPVCRVFNFTFSFRTFFTRWMIFSGLFIAAVRVFVVFFSVMWATILAQCLALVVLLAFYPRFCRIALSAGILYSLYYWAVLHGFSFFARGFFSLWNGVDLCGLSFAGLPVEEFFWVISASACWPVFMAYGQDGRVSSSGAPPGARGGFRKKVWQERTLGAVMAATAVVFAVDILGEVFSFSPAQSVWVDVAKAILPVGLLVLHATYLLSLRRGLALILLFFFIGFLAEMLGLAGGVFFGGQYFYGPGGSVIFSRLSLSHFLPTLWGVPVIVCVYWSVFLYAGYSLTNSFLFWTGREKPSRQNGERTFLFKLVIFDAALVLMIDLILDPILVGLKNWQWLSSGAYFGIPAGNFASWFMVAFLSSGIFRSFEYRYPQRREGCAPLISLFPAIGFSLFLAMAFAAAVRQGLYALVYIGLVSLFPIVVSNFYLFWARKKP
ncbi:MAG: carotenoid biosynthesis protein [Candidatus Omnitrophota bacterium]